MKTLDPHEVVSLLAAITRPTPIGIVALTDARPVRSRTLWYDARDTSNPPSQLWHRCPIELGEMAVPYVARNPYAQVFKLSRVWPMTGTSYERAVNAQLTREGNATPDAPFVAMPPSTRYTRISPALVQFPNGKFAVPVQFNSQFTQAAKPRFLVRKARLGRLQVVAKEAIAAFLPEPSEPTRQTDAGVENPVVWRTYGIESILRIAIGGETYRVRKLA